MECSWAELFEESASGMLYRKDRFLFMSVLVKEVAVILGDEPVLPPGCLFELFYVFGNEIVGGQFVFVVYVAVVGFAPPFLADVVGKVHYPDNRVNPVREEEMVILRLEVNFKGIRIVPVVELDEQEHCFNETALVLAGCRVGKGQIFGNAPGIIAEIDETVHRIAVGDDMTVASKFFRVVACMPPDLGTGETVPPYRVLSSGFAYHVSVVFVQCSSEHSGTGIFGDQIAYSLMLLRDNEACAFPCMGVTAQETQSSAGVEQNPFVCGGIAVQVFQRTVLGPPQGHGGFRSGENLGLVRTGVRPGESVALNFTISLEMIGNDAYDLVVRHVSVLQDSCETCNRKRNREKSATSWTDGIGERDLPCVFCFPLFIEDIVRKMSPRRISLDGRI